MGGGRDNVSLAIQAGEGEGICNQIIFGLLTSFILKDSGNSTFFMFVCQ